MATQYLKVRGEARWAKVYEKQKDTKYLTLEGAGVYSIQIKPDAESLADMKASGLRSKPSKDGEGFYTFRRPEFKMINGEKVEFGPPVVEGAEGKNIGNGSDVTVDIAVYDTKLGKGHRLNEVKVDYLVEFVPEKQASDKPPVD